jgi:hypothetical protein
MRAMTTVLVVATACTAMAAAPVLALAPRIDTRSAATTNLNVMTSHGDRVAYRDEGDG